MPADRLRNRVGRIWRLRVSLACAWATVVVSHAIAAEPAPRDDGWSIHGQTTFIGQGYPNIRSPYQGDNSLPGRGQLRETWTTTAFIGRRLWDGAELYFNPEMLQGFGLAHTLGVGGFPN